MRCILLILHVLYAYESINLPEWTRYPAATCTEIEDFLNKNCYDQPFAWIPFMFVNRTRKDIQCVQCRERHRLEHVCEHTPDTLHPLFLFDTRGCVN